jgi:virulence-associated protein VapD
VGKKLEEANFSRIQGTIYKQQAKLAQIQTASQTGTTLLKMGGYI